METPLRQPVPPGGYFTGMPSNTTTEHSGRAQLGCGREPHAMQHPVDVSSLEETLKRTMTPRLNDLERAVKDNEKLLRSFIETLQLWFDDFGGSPRKQRQASDEERVNAASAKQEDAVVPNDIQVASIQPSEGDRIEKAVQEQLGCLEQTLNLQFQKVMLQLTLARPTGNEVSCGGSYPTDTLKFAANIPTATVSPRTNDACMDALDAQSRTKSGADLDKSIYSPSKGPTVIVKPADASQGLGLRSQQHRLVRHIEHLARAVRNRDAGVKVQEWFQRTGLASILGNPVHTRSSRWNTAEFGNTIRHATTSHKSYPGFFWKRWPIEDITDSNLFNVMTTLLIVLNAIWIASSTDHAMKQFLKRGLQKPKYFEMIDLVFTILFAIELLIRLIAYRMRFFTQPTWRYNVFDIIVVATGMMDQFTRGIAMNSSALRAVRLLRVLRMLKFVRALTFFTELQQLLIAIMNSAKTLIWTLALFGFGTLLASITCMEVLLTFGDSNDANYRSLISKFYGSFTKSITTMFLCITYGDLWGNLTRDFSRHSPMIGYIIGTYVILMFFLVIPVLYGTHAMRVLNTQTYEPYVAMTRKLQDATTFIEALRHRIHDFGYRWDERIDVNAMEEMMENVEINTFLMANNIEVQAHDVFMIFDTENDGTISIGQFVFGCHFLTCTSTDTFLLSQQVAAVSKDMAALKDRVNTLNRVFNARSPLTLA